MGIVSSIKFKFTLWYLLVLTLLLAGLSVATYAYLSHSMYESLDNSLIVRADQLRGDRRVIETIAQGAFEEELGEVVVLYYERNGEIHSVSRRDVQIQLDAASVKDAIQGQSNLNTVAVEGAGTMRFRFVPFSSDRPVPALLRRGRGQVPVGIAIQSAALAVGQPTKHIEEALNELLRMLFVAFPLTLIVAGVGGVFLARRALKPVDQMAQTAREIEETDLSQRIAVNARDELGRLASTLNQMLERLERAFKRQREFTGDASHELRTPLSVIQAESTLALQRERRPEEYQRSLEAISDEAKHMSQIIEQMLVLARGDSGTGQVSFGKVELNGLLKKVGEDMAILSQEKGLRWTLRLNGPLTIEGDLDLLRRLFLNLADNAVRYTPHGGEVSIAAEAVDATALVSFSDSGIGIATDHIPHIFERFYRVDKARSRSDGGSGLGLAICKQIVELHGGQIEVHSREDKGSTFTVRLPLAQETNHPWSVSARPPPPLALD